MPFFYSIMRKLYTYTDVFKYYDDIALFSKFLNIPYDKIAECISDGIQIQSPLRHDKHPSLGFYLYHTKDGIVKTKMRDYAGYFWGDIIDYIAQQYRLDIKLNRIDILRRIEQAQKERIAIISYDKTISKQLTEFVVYPRTFYFNDINYWKQFSITLETLNEELVYPIDRLYINGELDYMYNPKDLAYAYYLGVLNNRTQWQIYFPNRKKHLKGKPKFKTNCSINHGYPTLKNARNLIITKSSKDRILIKQLIKEFELDFSCINIAAESNILSKLEYEYLISKGYQKIYSLYDLDNTGIIGMRKLKKDFNIIPIILPKYIVNLNVPYADAFYLKDLSDILRTFPKERSILIERFLNGVS